MMLKGVMMLGVAAMVGGFVMTAGSDQAEAARKRCVYMAHNPSTGHMIADGWGYAVKKDWACNRARRRCNRELERKRRQGKVGRGVVCRRITNL